VATLTTPPGEGGADLDALSERVGYLEVRADLVGDLDPEAVRERFGGGLIYTLRSRAEGGGHEGGKAGRERRLVAAAEGYDLVDLEADRDLHKGVLGRVPPEKRLISWHGPPLFLTALKNRFERMAETPARFYKLIPEARHEGDALRPLLLLHDLGRDDVVAFASGAVGSWSRIVAPRVGSPLVYGAFGAVPGAPGQLGVDQLERDYDLPEIPPAGRLFGIVGRPVAHSLSPRLHNAAYRTLGVPGLYLAFHAESFGDFWLDVVEGGGLEALDLPIRGLSVTAPYKEAALAVAGASSPRADHVGAANTLILHEGVWEAETTDPEGVVLALEHAGVPSVEGRRAAVVGCGGAGRAAAYGLEIAGAEVTLVNRSEERGRRAAEELGRPFVPLQDFDPAGFGVVVHATSLGHHDGDPLPFDVDRLDGDAAVVDMVYGRGPTPLVRAARRRGLVAVDGRSVLLHQALSQFRLMTGEELDPELGWRLLGLPEDGPEDGSKDGSKDNPGEER